MNARPLSRARLRARLVSERAFHTLQKFLHIEAVSGMALLAAALVALVWANSPAAQSYHDLWHAPLSFGIGPFVVSKSLHFWINDALMTVFFLVVGMEIRREIHEGALADPRSAMLPIAAALGGVAVPALIYLALNGAPVQRDGWAIPTATDIAFAVGILALLGKSVPINLRIFLLALAIIDDIVAILIIALFYSGGLDYAGLGIAAAGIVLVLALQVAGIGSAFAYVVPGAILWVGLLKAGAHPTLAGVMLGMMTPVLGFAGRERSLSIAEGAVDAIRRAASTSPVSAERVFAAAQRLRIAQRELVAPVTRVQMTLHPWVAYIVMPLFALANAGVSLDGLDLGRADAQHVLAGVLLALVVGKPVGVVLATWLMVRFGGGSLPAGVSWTGVLLAGLLAGIGFTMSIFIGTLAFADPVLLGAAKLGVLLASATAAAAGLAWGTAMLRRAPAGVPARRPGAS
jgi:NhaA family Na+:H+ antiporter